MQAAEAKLHARWTEAQENRVKTGTPKPKPKKYETKEEKEVSTHVALSRLRVSLTELPCPPHPPLLLAPPTLPSVRATRLA